MNNGAVLAAVCAVLLWSFSGVCFRKGSQLMGSMVYLTFMTAIGSFTAVLLHYFKGQPLSSLYRLPPRVCVSGIVGVAFYTVILSAAFGIAAESDLGQINLLNLMWPVWVVVLGFIFFAGQAKTDFSFSRNTSGTGRRNDIQRDGSVYPSARRSHSALFGVYGGPALVFLYCFIEKMGDSRG